MSLLLAAHKSRKGFSAVPPAAPAFSAAGSRAALAAARVAARYANAPSYSQMLDEEPRAVPSASEAPAAKEADGIAAVTGQRFWDPDAPPAGVSPASSAPEREVAPPSFHTGPPSSLEDWEKECAHNRFEPDLRLRPLELVRAPVEATPISAPAPDPISSPEPEGIPEPEAARAPHAAGVLPTPSFSTFEDARWNWPERVRDLSESEEIEPVEPDLPIPANLIEFPRELVATRKMRPRRAEGPFAAARPERQLSIFEVDPGAVSTRPDSSAAVALAVWPEPSWAEIELEPQAREDAEPDEAPCASSDLQLAPIGQRLVAALVDGGIVATMVLVVALAAANKISLPHSSKVLELGGVLAFLAAGMLYDAIFLMLSGATPGMSFARISLCTFDGQIPTRTQLRNRLGALLLSLVPVGLGLAWALFDDDRLCWHDRLSKTYLREN